MLTIAETKIFSRYVSDYWTEEERGEFAAWIAEHFDAGDVVRGSGGCRNRAKDYGGYRDSGRTGLGRFGGDFAPPFQDRRAGTMERAPRLSRTAQAGFRCARHRDPPHLTLYAGQDKQGNSPVFRVIRPRDAEQPKSINPWNRSQLSGRGELIRPNKWLHANKFAPALSHHFF